MKLDLIRKCAVGALAAAISVSSFAGEYREEVLSIAKEFENSDPDAQYTARRNLEILVSAATAPEKSGGAAEITGDLLYALSQPESSREAKKYILRQLARVGTSKAVAPLAKLMMEEDALLAENARKAIESIKGNKAANALKKAYSKMDESGKKDIIRSLAHRGESSSIGFLGKELNSDSDVVASVAAWALGEIGGAKALNTLKAAYGSGLSKGVAGVVERSLLSHSSIDADTIADIFESGSSISTRRAALRELIGRKDDRALEVLEAGLESDDLDMRSIAIESGLASGVDDCQSLVLDRAIQMSGDDLAVLLAGLRNVRPETAETIGLQIFENGDEALQLNTLELLGEVGSVRSIGALLRTFDEGSRALKIKASLALAQLDSPALNDWLNDMLSSGVEKDVLLAQEVLAYRNVPGAKERLLEFVSHENADFSKGALKTLSVIADESDLDQLYSISRKSTGETERLIISLLKKLAPEFGSESLKSRVEAL